MFDLFGDLLEGLGAVGECIADTLEPHMVHDGGVMENFIAGAANAAMIMGTVGYVGSLGTSIAAKAMVQSGIALANIAYGNHTYVPIPRGWPVGQYARYDSNDLGEPSVIYDNGNPYVRSDLMA